jgi:FkbM family methyltransferase
MTKLGLRPYRQGDEPAASTVPVCVVVLTRDEEANLRRCLASVAWADQVVVVDSGSRDGTVSAARSLGAQVIEQPWLGFSAQREFALRLPEIRHDWIYFVDADEWISPELAAEIAGHFPTPGCAAFSHRLRLVFAGRWIRHCGWYSASLVVRLVDRRYTKFNGELVSERACVDGDVQRLSNDIVDEDQKGIARWLYKHVSYAQLQAERRGAPLPLSHRIASLNYRDRTRPLSSALLKDVVFPSLPAKPVALFLYMYIARLGLLDGTAGLRFCFFHAWYEACVSAIQAEGARLTLTRRSNGSDMPVLAQSAIAPILGQRLPVRGPARILYRSYSRAEFRPGQPAKLLTTKHGDRFTADLSSFLEWQLWAFGAYEEHLAELFRHLTGPGDRCVDVGANVGVHTIRLAKLVGPDGAVIALEPDAQIAHRLRDNVSLNQLTNVQVHEAAAAERPGDSVTLHRPDSLDSNKGRASLLPHSYLTGSKKAVIATTIDDLAGGPVALIKIDVEGFEGAVVAGAGRTIAASFPSIIFEHAPGMLSDSFPSPFRHLSAEGYRLYRISQARQRLTGRGNLALERIRTQPTTDANILAVSPAVLPRITSLIR